MPDSPSGGRIVLSCCRLPLPPSCSAAQRNSYHLSPSTLRIKILAAALDAPVHVPCFYNLTCPRLTGLFSSINLEQVPQLHYARILQHREAQKSFDSREEDYPLPSATAAGQWTRPAPHRPLQNLSSENLLPCPVSSLPTKPPEDFSSSSASAPRSPTTGATRSRTPTLRETCQSCGRAAEML